MVNETVETLEEGKIYSGGCASEIERFFASHSKNERPKILYVGDHLISDVQVPLAFVLEDKKKKKKTDLKEENRSSNWDTVAIIEELEPMIDAPSVDGQTASHK